MAETLNEHEEKKLIDAVKRAVDLVDSGMHPNDALERVAREEKFGPGKIKLAAHAYNNGTQLNQWQSGVHAPVLKKLSAFELADPDRIIANIFGETTNKSASNKVAADYFLPPSWLPDSKKQKLKEVLWQHKQASAAPLASDLLEPEKLWQERKEPEREIRKAYALTQQVKQAAEEQRRRVYEIEQKLHAKVAELVDYFQKQAGYRLPFDLVEQAALTYFGGVAKPLLDVVHQRANLREKRASHLYPLLQGIDYNSKPLATIREAIDLAEQHQTALAQSIAKTAEAKLTKEAAFRPFLKSKSHDPTYPAVSDSLLDSFVDPYTGLLNKKGSHSWFSDVAAIAAGDIAGQAIHHRIDPLMEAEHRSKPISSEEDLEAELEMEDMQKEIQGIRSKVDLERIIGNPQFKEYSPAKITQAYNDVVRMSPDLIDNIPALEKAIEIRLADNLSKKTAFDMTDFGVGIIATKTLGSPVKHRSEIVTDIATELEEPKIKNRIRSIRANALLAELMSDPDDPISAHDPAKVLAAYNEIAATAPRLADNIYAIRPLLRRRLEGNQEPFEIKELLDTEKGVGESYAKRISTYVPNVEEK